MSEQARRAVHALAALALPLIVFAGSTVGTVETFQNWLIGASDMTPRLLPHVMSLTLAGVMVVRAASAGAGETMRRWTLGGALAAFAVAFAAVAAAGLSPLAGLVLIAAGAGAGWVAAPRGKP